MVCMHVLLPLQSEHAQSAVLHMKGWQVLTMRVRWMRCNKISVLLLQDSHTYLQFRAPIEQLNSYPPPNSRLTPSNMFTHPPAIPHTVSSKRQELAWRHPARTPYAIQRCLCTQHFCRADHCAARGLALSNHKANFLPSSKSSQNFES